MGKLDEAVEKWAWESERYGPRCLWMSHIPNCSGRRYYVFSRDVQISVFKRNPIFHEAIFPGERVKLHYDFDLKKDEIDEGLNLHEDGRRRLDILKKQTVELLKGLGYDHIEEPLCFLGIREDKFSVHLIYPNTWFESPAHLLRFIQPVDKAVDRSVLTRALGETPAFLRMPFARRFKELKNPITNELYSVEVPGSELLLDGHITFKPHLLYLGCVSIGMCKPPSDESRYVKISDPIVRQSFKSNSKAADIHPALYRAIIHGASAVLEYIGAYNSQIEVDAPDAWRAYVKAEVFCRMLYQSKKKRTVHENNNAMVRMFRDSDWRLRVCVKCLDPDCKGWEEFFAEDFTYLYTRVIQMSLEAQSSGQSLITQA
jgi:hypothetical protein